MKNCRNVYEAMKQAQNLAQDHAWNGEEELYKKRIAQYQYYKALFDQGVEWDPLF